MKSRILIVFLIILLILTTGCSAAKVNAPPPDNGYNRNGAAENATGNDTDIEDSIRKVIKNGYLDLATDDVAKTYANILTFASNNDGYEYSHQMTVNDSYTKIKAVLKIKPAKLEAIMSYMGDIAEVINSSTNSDDITDKYYDAQTRILTKKKMLDNYYNYLESAKSIDETLSLQKVIDQITEDIEALEGKLNLWDSLTDEATLTITISQKNDPQKPQKAVDWNALSWNDMGTLITNGFVTVMNVIVSIVQWFVIFLASVSPVLIIASIIIVIIKRKTIFKKKKHGEKDDKK